VRRGGAGRLADLVCRYRRRHRSGARLAAGPGRRRCRHGSWRGAHFDLRGFPPAAARDYRPPESRFCGHHLWGGEHGLRCLLNVRAAPVVRLAREWTRPVPVPHVSRVNRVGAQACLGGLPPASRQANGEWAVRSGLRIDTLDLNCLCAVLANAGLKSEVALGPVVLFCCQGYHGGRYLNAAGATRGQRMGR
jgi:hypothetical protein